VSELQKALEQERARAQAATEKLTSLEATQAGVQANPSRVDPPPSADHIAPLEPTAPSSAQPRSGITLSSERITRNEQAARNLAFAYLGLWSAPNTVALASASSFYGPTVRFHGRTRTLGSVLAEKRRFAERWPDRSYRYRPETTQVACEADGAHCTVWSMFDYSASNPRQGRRSRGIGEHELVVDLSSEQPVIASENSRLVPADTKTSPRSSNSGSSSALP
jgi:hypothetical protein